MKLCEKQVWFLPVKTAEMPIGRIFYVVFVMPGRYFCTTPNRLPDEEIIGPVALLLGSTSG